MSKGEQVWRVVLATGEVREAFPEHNGVQWCTFVDGYHGWGRTPHASICAVVGLHGWPVAEILAPGESTRAELAAQFAAVTAERDALAPLVTEARRVLHFARAVVDAWDIASSDGDGPNMDAVDAAIRTLADEAGDWTLAGPHTTHDALAKARDDAREERDAMRRERDEARAEVRRLTAALATARREGAEAMREACEAACARVRAESDRGTLGLDRDEAYFTGRRFGAWRCADALLALPLPGDALPEHATTPAPVCPAPTEGT